MYCYDYPRPAVTVDVVIMRRLPENGLELLLIRRAHPPFEGKWALPGGFVGENEALQEAAARELLEETGIDGLPIEQFGVFGKPGRDPRGHTISIAFAGIVSDRPVSLAGDDAEAVAWYSKDSLPPLAFDHDEIVREALDHLSRKFRPRERR
jgi:8-oxo-dGTP diphosphatase